MSGSLRFPYVTAALSVNYRKPVPIDKAIDLRARVVEFGERKAIVHCKVSCQGILCAEAEVVAVRMMAQRRPAAEVSKVQASFVPIPT
jgi:acyl-CoA thioesterase FadM